jgi:hypothetical protein
MMGIQTVNGSMVSAPHGPRYPDVGIEDIPSRNRRFACMGCSGINHRHEMHQADGAESERQEQR